MIRVKKFKSAKALEIWMNGGLIMGPAPSAETNGMPVWNSLVGKTLIFIQPTPVTVTFVTGDFVNPARPTFGEIRTKVQTAVAGLRVFQNDQRMCFIENTPTNGVSLDKDGTANQVLGFPRGEDTTNVLHPGSEVVDFATGPDETLIVILES